MSSDKFMCPNCHTIKEEKMTARGIVISLVFIIGALSGYLSQFPNPTLPKTPEEIQASAQAEQDRLNLIHKNQMEYQAAQLATEKAKAARPATQEEIDSESISVGERVGLKFFLGI